MIHDPHKVEEARRFLAALHGPPREGEYVELRWRPSGSGGSMRRWFFPNAEAAARQAVSLGSLNDVYVGVAPRRGRDGTRTGVRRMTAVFSDLDTKDGHTLESRLRQLEELPHRPSVLVESGGGWHPYWLLEAPAEGPEQLERVEAVMRRLGAGLAGDPVWDRTRVLRMPGTFNQKYDEPRPVGIEHLDPNLRYRLGDLEDMARAFPDKGALAGGGKVPREALGAPIGSGKRNLTLVSVAGSLRDRGLDEDTIGCVLLEVNRLRCQPPLDGSEVLRIAESVGRYPAGRPRYPRSSAKRVYPIAGVDR